MPVTEGVDTLAEKLRASAAVLNGAGEAVEDSQCEPGSPPLAGEAGTVEENATDSHRRHRRKPSRPQNLRTLNRKPGQTSPQQQLSSLDEEEDEDEGEELEEMATLPPQLQPPASTPLNLTQTNLEPDIHARRLFMQQIQQLPPFDEHGALDLSTRPGPPAPLLPRLDVPAAINALFPIPPPPNDPNQQNQVINLLQAQLAAHFLGLNLPGTPGNQQSGLPQVNNNNNNNNNNSSPLPSASTAASSVKEEEPSIKNETSQEMKMAETQQAHTIRFANYEECGNDACARAGLKDHCHCTTCNKVLPRRDDLIRHMRWHIKREHALENGFMRFSAGDDCERASCTHKHRQTHYHCIRQNCDKVYISTSDCQMHANYHKKYAALLEKGFLRFRASDDCREAACPFRNDRTTHFHCTRKDCSYYFKNKADCEKHSTHHNRNDSLAKENFRKYLKYEDCLFSGCKYNRTMNHIHCLVTGCNYVVHSMGQTLPHKRKHERRGEVGPVEEMDTDSFSMGPNAATQAPILNLSQPPAPPVVKEEEEEDVDDEEEEEEEGIGERLRALEQEGSLDLEGSLSLPIPTAPSDALRQEVMRIVEAEEKEEGWKRYLRRYTANDACVPHCPMLYQDHYHCQASACRETFKTREKVREHARSHALEDVVTAKAFRMCQQAECGPEVHFHCLWTGCHFACDNEPTPAFLRLQHYKTHDLGYNSLANRKRSAASVGNGAGLNLTPARNPPAAGISTDPAQNTPRRRGRPPKHNKNVVVPRPDVQPDQFNEEPGRATLTVEDFFAAPNAVFCGFKAYQLGQACPDDKCQFSGKLHFHCLRPRCYHASNTLNEVNLHRSEFHAYMTIQEGFEFFDNHVCCRRSHCHNSKTTRHYHCTRRNCDYAFVRHNTMEQHAKRHLAADAAAAQGGINLVPKQEGQPVVQGPPTLTLGMGATRSPTNLTTNNLPRPPVPLPMSQYAALAAAMMAQGTWASGGVDVSILSKHLQSVIAANLGMPLGPNMSNMMPPSSMPPLLPIPEVVPRCHFAAEACPRLACAFKSVEHFHCGLCDQGCLDSLLLASHVAEAHPGAILAPPLLPPSNVLKRGATDDSIFPAPPLKREWERDEDHAEADDELEEEETTVEKDGGSSSAPQSAAEEDAEEEEEERPLLTSTPEEGASIGCGEVQGFDFFPVDTDCASADCEFARRSAHFHCTQCTYACADRKKSLAHSYSHFDP